MLPSLPTAAGGQDGRPTSEENSGGLFDSAHETPAPCADAEIIRLFDDADGAVGRPPDDWRIQEANRRLRIIETFQNLIAPIDEGGQGKTRKDAVALVGVSYPTLWRWLKRFEKEGYNGLLPNTDECGRKNIFEKLGMTPEQVEELRAELQGINLDMATVTGTLRAYASSDRCPPQLAQIILDPTRCSKHALPPSLRELAKTALATRDAHRGPRRLSLKGFSIPRKMDVTPGDVFSSDDTTPIWAWWVPWRESEEYPYGVKLLQGQLLPMIDVASQCPLTWCLIAREKGSYRASDIWALFGHTFDTVGLPRLGFQLERGSWEANLIGGQEVKYEEGEASYSRRIGGLRQLPTNPHDQLKDFTWPKTLQIFTSYLPKSKSIEAFMNRAQTLEGTLWGCMGRDQMRKPFEKVRKLFQACQRGAEDPRNHFLSHTEMAVRINKLLEYLGYEPMEGEVFSGIPRQKFEAAIAERPLFTFQGELEGLRWLYKSDWAVVQVTQGCARVRLTHPVTGDRYSLFYTNPAVFAEIEGKQVAVYYDREKFEQPAQIVAAVPMTVRGQRYDAGEYLCEAQYVERVGTFLGTETTGRELAKAWRNAVMTTYGTIVKHAPSRQLPPEIAARRAAARQVEAAAVQTTRSTPAAPMRSGARPVLDPSDIASMASRPAPQQQGSGYAISIEEMNQL